MQQVLKLLQAWVEQKKTGKLSFNFFKGVIVNVNLEESKKLQESEKKQLLPKSLDKNNDKTP